MSIAGQVEVLLIAVTQEAAVIADLASEYAKGKIEQKEIRISGN